MRALGKLTWVEAKLFVRDPLSLVFTLALPVFMILVLPGVFGDEQEPIETDPWRGFHPAVYLVPAYVALVMAAIGTLSMPTQLATYRERGVLRRFRASSMPLWAVLVAQVVLALVIAIIGAVLIALIGLAVYGAALPTALHLVIPALVLGALCFSAIGVLLGAVMPTSRSAQGGGLMLFFLMWILGGSGPPEDIMTDELSAISTILPMTYVVRLLRDAWLNSQWDLGSSIVVVAVFVGATVLSQRLFRWD